jgi:hypothetical protein
MLPPSFVELHASLGLPADYAARRGLAFRPEADIATLVTIAHTTDHRPIQLTAAASSAWANLHLSALSTGLTLIPVSGFRSVARQTEIIRVHLAAGRALEEIQRTPHRPRRRHHRARRPAACRRFRAHARLRLAFAARRHLRISPVIPAPQSPRHRLRTVALVLAILTSAYRNQQ